MCLGGGAAEPEVPARVTSAAVAGGYGGDCRRVLVVELGRRERLVVVVLARLAGSLVGLCRAGS